MSTYSDASLILPVAPEYKAGKIYSLKPTDGSGDFTVARASKKHRINSDLKLAIIDNNIPAFNFDAIGGCPFLNTEPQATNLITYPISFGNFYWTKSGASIEGDPSTAGAELITVAADRDFSSDTGFWTKGTGWSIGSGLATKTAGTASSIKNTTLATLVSGTMYKLTFTISNYTGGTLNPYIEGTYYKEVSANGTYNAYLVAGTSAASIDFYADIAFAGSIDDVSIKEVQGYSAPSVNFPTSAFKLVESATTSEHKIERRISAVSTDKHTLYVYAKANTRDRITIQNFDNSIQYAGATFDLLNGVIVGDITGSAEIKTMDNGWYKCSVTGTPPTTGLGYQEIALAESTHAGSIFLDNYLGDGTSGVYIFMAQFEQGSVATSPTFTDTTLASEGSTTTRLADVVTGAVDVNTFNDSEGVLFAEISGFSNTDSSPRVFSLSDGSGSNRIICFLYNTEFVANIQKLGETTIDLRKDLGDVKTPFKIGVKYKANDFALWINGFEVASSSSGQTYSEGTLDRLNFDSGYGIENFYGNTKQMQYFNTALSDAELQALTTL